MRPQFRIPSDDTLKHLSDTDLRLFVAHQKYNVRAKRLALKELRQRRATPTYAQAPSLTPPPFVPPMSEDRPKGGLADVAWLGVLLGAGALGLQILSWAMASG